MIGEQELFVRRMDAPIKPTYDKLRRMGMAGAASGAEVTSACRSVARHVLSALADDDHRLAHQVSRMLSYAKAAQEQESQSERPDEEHSNGKTVLRKATVASSLERQYLAWLLSPQPGIGATEALLPWHTQLLLLATCNSDTHRAALADHLGVNVSTLEAAASIAFKRSAQKWTTVAYAARLAEAVDLMLVPSPAPDLILSGRSLSSRTQKVRLSQQETLFVQALALADGETVPRAVLAQAGIANPTQVKTKLLKKLERVSITVIIEPLAGGYRLATPIEIRNADA